MFRNTESKIRMKIFPSLSESAPSQDAGSPNLGKVFLGDYENEILCVSLPCTEIVASVRDHDFDACPKQLWSLLRIKSTKCKVKSTLPQPLEKRLIFSPWNQCRVSWLLERQDNQVFEMQGILYIRHSKWSIGSLFDKSLVNKFFASHNTGHGITNDHIF